MYRLDTLLLAGSGDIMHLVVEENLSAVEYVRLSMCCKGLKVFLLSTPGLMYLPMHKTFPCITGLAFGRKPVYYLSILKRYFGDKGVWPRAFMMRDIWPDIFAYNFREASVEELVSRCVYENRAKYESRRGRESLKWCLNEIRQCMGHRSYRHLTEKAIPIINLLDSSVQNAFCVINRRLVPGIARVEPLPAHRLGVEYNVDPGSGSEDS